MESPHDFCAVHWDREPVRIPLNRPSGSFSPTGGEGWNEGARFMDRRRRDAASDFLARNFFLVRSSQRIERLVVLKSWFRCANATAGPPPDRQSQGTALPLLTWLALSPPCFARIPNPPRNLGGEKKRAVPSQNDASVPEAGLPVSGMPVSFSPLNF